MISYQGYLRRQPNFKQPVGVSVVLQTPHRFLPRPGMPAEDIAFAKGREARQIGGANPYAPEDPLAEHWNRGYANQTDGA